MPSQATIQKLADLKEQLGNLWDARGTTDGEILAVATRIDKLLNEHYRLTAGSSQQTSG